jgi:penicillin-binding protein 2
MIAGDCITYLYDAAKALEKLTGFEKDWGGTPQERGERQLNEFRITKGLAAAALSPENVANVSGSANDAQSAEETVTDSDEAREREPGGTPDAPEVQPAAAPAPRLPEAQ